MRPFESNDLKDGDNYKDKKKDKDKDEVR